MGFIKETSKLLGISNNYSSETFCYLSHNHGIVVEGHKKILELSLEKIKVLCEDKLKIEILGNNLNIKEISFREICVTGKIKAINFEE